MDKKAQLKKIGIILGAVLLLGLVFVVAQVIITPITPLVNTTTSDSSVLLDFNITNDNLQNITLNFNNLSYTTYLNTLLPAGNYSFFSSKNGNTVVTYLFDNLTELGENSTLVYDLAGTKNITKFMVAPTFVSSQNGKAIDFNGSNYLDTDYNTNIEGNLSLCSRFMVKSNNSQQYSDIFSKSYDFRLYFEQTGKDVTFVVRNETGGTGSDRTYGDGTDINYGTWNDMCFTFNNNTDTGEFYLNGLLIETITNHKGIFNTTTNFWFGRGSGSNFYSNSSIDYFFIVNKTLSYNDVRIIHNASIIKYNTTNFNFKYSYLLDFDSSLLNSTNPSNVNTYNLCSSNLTTQICSDLKSITQVIPTKQVSANFTTTVGLRNPEFFGANHAPRFMTNYSWIDLNGDGGLDTHSNYTWIIQTLKEEGVVFLTDDMLLGSKTYGFANPSLEQWVNSTSGLFVNYTTKNSVNIHPWGWTPVSIDASGGNLTIGRSTDAHSGNYSYNLSNVQTGGTNIYQTIYEPTYGQMELNHIYNFSIWVKTSSNVWIGFQRKDTFASVCSNSFIGNGNWQLLSCSANITEIIANGWRVNVQFYTGGSYLLDDVSITNNNRTWWWLYGNDSSPSYSRTNINEDKEMLKTAYENGFVLQMNTLNMPKWLQNISSGCNITLYSQTSGSCAPTNYSLWGELVKEYVDEILDGHSERLSAFRIEEYNEPDVSPWLNNYSTDDIRKATGFVLLHNATVNGVRPYYPNLEISLTSTSSALRPNMLPTMISNFSYNNDRYGWHRYTDNPYSDLQISTDVMLGNCTVSGANCSNWIIGEWNVASVSIKNYSDSSGGLRDRNIMQQGLIWGLSKYPSNVTMVQYESMEDSSYKNTSVYAEYPSRWAMFSQAGLDNVAPTYYWSYNVTKNSAKLCPANSEIKSMNLSTNLLGVSCKKGTLYSIIILNNATQSYNLSNLDLTGAYPYNNITNYETGEIYNIVNGIVQLGSDSIMDSYVPNSQNNIIYLSSGVPPTISSISPSNNTYLSSSNINFSANLTDDVGLTNATLFIYNTSGTLIQNVITYVAGEITVHQSWLIPLVDGIYNWWISLWDNEGKNTITGNYTLTVNANAPDISFVSPTTASTNLSQSNIYLNVSTADVFNHSVLSNIGLKLWLRYNNDTGENETYIKDYSGDGNNANVLNGTSSNSSGKLGYCMKFDGINDIITTTSSTSNLNITDAITLSSWVRIDSYLSYSRILARSTLANGYPYTIYGLLLDGNTGGFSRVRMEMASGGYQHIIRSTTNLTNGQWYLVTATWDGNNTKMYINGVLDNSTLYISYSNGTVIPVSNIYNGKIDTNVNHVSVGNSAYGVNMFNGSIDESIIYDRALSSNEVMALYNATRLDYNITNLADGNYNVTAYAQDMYGQVNSTSRWITLDNPPTYSQISIDNTVSGFVTIFSINISDLSLQSNGQYIFSTNNSGTWINYSAVNFTSTPSWANSTALLNTSNNIIVGYRWFISDNIGNLNSTPIYTLTTYIPIVGEGGGPGGSSSGGGTFCYVIQDGKCIGLGWYLSCSYSAYSNLSVCENALNTPTNVNKTNEAMLLPIIVDGKVSVENIKSWINKNSWIWIIITIFLGLLIFTLSKKKKISY